MKQKRLKEILTVLLNIDDIDIIKYTIESLIEEIDLTLDNKKDSEDN